MNYTIKVALMKEWSLNDDGIFVGGNKIPLNTITKVEYTPVTSPSKNGVVQIFVGAKFYTLAFPYKQKENGEIAAKYILENYGDDSRKQRYEKDNEGVVYDLVGVRGRTMKVFADRVVIKTAATLGNLFIGNATDGEKTIYYSDCIGVQFKESGVTIGYLQLETASGMMNNNQSNFFNENSFTFDPSAISNDRMRDVAAYIRERISEAKKAKNAPSVVQQISAADELKKFKELLDMGILTQEEFDAKKKQLLGM